MRTTIIPAQITTVEDKIAANLSMTQLMILIIPILWSLFLFVTVPPTFHFTLIKGITITVVALLCVLLALRFKGVIILQWVVLYLRYVSRPMDYVLNKSDLFGRSSNEKRLENEPNTHIAKQKEVKTFQASQSPLFGHLGNEFASPEGESAVRFVFGRERITHVATE